ncbi:MAG: hypothetical protein ACFB11_03875 [Paracoccaceae bacterium]
MTGSIGAVSADLTPQQAAIDDVSSQTTSDLHRTNLLADMSETAFASVTAYPGKAEKDAQLKGEILREAGGNPYISGTQAPDKPEALSDHFITKMSSLYNEVTVYQVAWNMAKRTGRDIETLLKAQ